VTPTRRRALELQEQLLTTAQVCGRLEISASTIRRLVAAGQLERRRIGNLDLYFAVDVEKLARARSAELMEDATR